ncbi:MAG: hypothetical protein JWR19_154 [Pedosphaera sp.]|nr:hypothetical protein [Pedosphaera sp.]
MNAKLTPGKKGPTPALQSQSAPIIERAPLPIVEVQGSTHMVSYVNAAFCSLLGKTREELLGNPFAAIVPGGNECVPILDEVYETGAAATHAQPDHSEPNPAYWLYAMWPALDANERPVGVIIQLTKTVDFRRNVTAINEALLIAGLRQHELTEAAEQLNAQLQKEITERKLAETALHEAKDRLADRAGELERLVTERTEKLRETVGELEGFSYSVSHDMRAPLRAMQSYAHYLLDEYGSQLDEQGVKYLQQIKRSAVRLDRLIQSVMSYTNILHARLPVERVNLDRLVREIIETFPNERPIPPQIQIKGTLPEVMGNEAMLTQCVSNLLSNGVKFVPAGTVPLLEVWAEEREPALIRVWFKDNGLGIAPENHKRIFRMFERIYPATEYEGTGIGLTIVRKAAERMGGQAGFESQLGHGSSFWIELKKG